MSKKSGEGKKIVGFSVPSELHKQFQTAAKNAGQTGSQAVINSMMAYIDKVNELQTKNYNDFVKIGEFLTVHSKILEAHGHSILFLLSLIDEIIEAIPELRNKFADQKLKVNEFVKSIVV